MVRPFAFASALAVLVSTSALLMSSFIAIPAMAQVAPPPAAAKTPVPEADPVVGRVNGETVKRSDVMREAESLPPQFAQLPINALWPLLLDRVLDRIKAVSAEQVRAAAKAYFVDDTLTVVVLEPQPLNQARPRSAPTGMRH